MMLPKWPLFPVRNIPFGSGFALCRVSLVFLMHHPKGGLFKMMISESSFLVVTYFLRVCDRRSHNLGEMM